MTASSCWGFCGDGLKMSGGDREFEKMLAVGTPPSPACDRKEGTEEGVLVNALF